MSKTELREVASTDLAKYDFLLERIAELEAAKAETRLRPEESKLRGLQQTLASYEGTLQELHRAYEERHKLTHKAEGSFDLLGRKHKQRRVDAQREKEQQACQAEESQKKRIEKLTQRIHAQKELVLDLRKKTRELDAVRQAEADFVDRLFHSNGIILDPQHDALEDAVCALAPRQFKLRETSSVLAVVQSKLESALHQLKDATDELERVYEPAHRILKDKYGDELGEEFFDSADEVTKRNATITADQLVRAALQNIAKARSRMPALPGLQPEGMVSLTSCIGALVQPTAGLDHITIHRLARDCINAVYISRSQIDYAFRCVSEEAAQIQKSLQHLESVLSQSRSQLDVHRRNLLSQVQLAKRSNSLRLSDDGSYSGTLSTVRATFQEQWAGSSVYSMRNKVPSVNSGLCKLG